MTCIPDPEPMRESTSHPPSPPAPGAARGRRGALVAAAVAVVAFAAIGAAAAPDRTAVAANRTAAGVPPSVGAPTPAAALAAFDTVQRVLQHPRCQNCHIPGDAPLQFDEGVPHAQNVHRGPEGKGAAGLPCATCHAAANPPASYGPHAPPGAPNWHLPPPERKMVFIGLSKADLCATIKDPARNGGKDFAALVEHVSHDQLVLWGWHPGGERAPVPISHDAFVASFKTWIAAGAPCPPAPGASRASR
jgi:hypothetical protein